MRYTRPLELTIYFFNNKKGYGVLTYIKAEYHHNHSWQDSIDHSSSPDLHLKRCNILPSQVAPMTGFHQRICISVPTVLVKCGDLEMFRTPFPYIAPMPDRFVFTAKVPLVDFYAIL